MNEITLSMADLYAPIREDLKLVESVFDSEVASSLPFVNGLCDTVRSYRGKMLRPALLLLSGKAAGEVFPGHHTLAAVVEMVHMATLVHDDVLDSADERRGRAPINAVAGNVAAVLLGDYLISHAFHLCSGLDSQHASRLIGAATNAVCEGELLQNKSRGHAELSEPEYIDIIRRKTGTLTAVSCRLGASHAGADHTVVRAMHAYGMSVGVAFQIADDVLDVIGDRVRVGKTLGRDFALGKLTLPTIHCLAHARGAVRARLRAAVVGDGPVDAEELRDLLKSSGSIEYALSVASESVADSLRQLDLLPPSDARTSLTALAEFIIQRQF